MKFVFCQIQSNRHNRFHGLLLAFVDGRFDTSILAHPTPFLEGGGDHFIDLLAGMIIFFRDP
jgi:hypothetical protein